jgi:hypothetical protein
MRPGSYKGLERSVSIFYHILILLSLQVDFGLLRKDDDGTPWFSLEVGGNFPLISLSKKCPSTERRLP